MPDESAQLTPFYHPTQIVLVADDIDFLGGLRLQLDAGLAYVLFDSATKALDYINGRDSFDRARERFFGLDEAGAARAGGQLGSDALLRQMLYTDRFSRISVVLADYATAQMSGIELCERIHSPHIKKILLTDPTNEADADRAFCRGVIDRAMHKYPADGHARLNRAIRELQHAYIADIFAAVRDKFRFDRPDVLANREIAALLERLKTRYTLHEYYLTAAPTGFVLVDGNARVYRLVLCDAAERAAQADRALRYRAPRICVDTVRRGEVILAPAITDGSHRTQAERYRLWQDYALAATPLRGARDYRWAISDSALFTYGIQRPAASFYSYLEWLDTVGYSLM